MTGWKKKEKELTAEEALILAKKEFEPYWIGSPPLIVGVRSKQKSMIIPISPDFSKKPWLILFLDPTTLGGDSAFHYFKEWYRLYHFYHLNMMAILIPSYSYIKSPELIARTKEWTTAGFPVVIDIEGAITSGFHVEQLPKIMLLHQDKIHFAESGTKWWKGVEKNIQNFLRISDPGLPLIPVDESFGSNLMLVDTSRIELGYRSFLGKNPEFLPTNFTSQEGELRTAQFKGTMPALIPPDKIYLTGKWSQSSEKIMTSDSHATLGFSCLSARLSIIAQSEGKESDTGMITVEVDSEPAYDAIAGSHLILDDAGRSLVKVTTAHLYHLLVELDAKTPKQIVLKFPQANLVPCGIYGIRFGEKI